MTNHCYTEYASQKKALLETCLLELMQQQPYKEISVTDICRTAKIPRRTFYHYFENKDDILDTIVKNLLLQCFLTSMYDLTIDVNNMKNCFVRIFRFWEGGNRSKLDILMQNGLESRLLSWSIHFIRAEKIPILRTSRLEPKLIDIGLRISITGFFSLLFYWNQNGYQETPEQMAEYAMGVLPQAFYQL